MEKTNYFSELILTKPCDAEQHVKLLVPFYYLGLQEKRGKKRAYISWIIFCFRHFLTYCIMIWQLHKKIKSYLGSYQILFIKIENTSNSDCRIALDG